MDALLALLQRSQSLTVTPPVAQSLVECAPTPLTVATHLGEDGAETEPRTGRDGAETKQSLEPLPESITPSNPAKQSSPAPAPIISKVQTCEYCTKISHHIVLHDEQEMKECLAERPKEPEKAAPELPKNHLLQPCPICGVLWGNHSESALAGCEAEVEKARRLLTEQELAILAEFNSVMDKLADMEVNYLLVSNYFRTENKKLFDSDELLRRKIVAYQKCYVIGRIGESTLHQDKPEKMLELKGDAGELSYSTLTRGKKEKKASEPKVKKSPMERQIEKWVSIGMTEEAAQNLWNDTIGNSKK